jgi:hypothetical protein
MHWRQWLRRMGWVGFGLYLLKGLTWLLIPLWVSGKGCGS